MAERDSQNREGWKPDTSQSGEEAIREEERSLDVGESGQFAPGGYYNQQRINEPERSSLDDADDK